ncbi:hypothetical protein GC176_20595 [bacterium]|nr:hypothetical protein [bacterium]
MNDHNHNDWEQLFEQLPADTEVRDEHRARLREQFLDSFQAEPSTAARRHLIRDTGRILMKYKVPHCTAVTLLVAGAIWILQHSTPAYALEQIVDNLVKAQSARFEMTVKVEGLPEQKMKAFYLEPAHFRQELMNGYVNISDWNAGKTIGLEPNTKQATVLNIVNIPEEARNQQQNQFDAIREMLRKAASDPNTKVETLGEKQLDGKTVVGFRFRDIPMPMTLWADPVTQLPVRIEATMIGPPKTEVVMSNYEFNVKLDASLFSLKVPDGYTVLEADVDASKPAEKDLIASLKMCSNELGEFPAGFDAVAIGSFAGKYLAKQGLNAQRGPTKEQMQSVIKISRGLQFAMLLPAESDAHYAGAKAKPGDKEQAIFWYRPDGSTKYRVIYADLSVKEVDAAPGISDAIKLQQ